MLSRARLACAVSAMTNAITVTIAINIAITIASAIVLLLLLLLLLLLYYIIFPQSEFASVGVLADTVRDEVRFVADFGVPKCRVPGCRLPGAGGMWPKKLIEAS